MTLKELAIQLKCFTDENFSKKMYQPFYRALYKLSMQGRGIDIRNDLANSGETFAMSEVRNILDRRFAGQTWSIFDVGANTGQFLSKAITTFGTDHARYFSFEPAPAAFAELQKTHGNNPAVTLVNAGIGDAEEQRTLYANSPSSPLASLYPRRLAHVGIPFKPLGTVTVRTLDQFAAENNIERIHFLKLDVEGHEYNCLLGAKKLLADRRIACIQFEMGGTNIDSRTFFQDFWYALPNFNIFRVLRDGLDLIKMYDEYEEIFLGQNFLAVLKD